MRYDILVTWRDDNPPGPSLFTDLHLMGATEMTQNGTMKQAEVVYMTAYATLNTPAPLARQLADDLYVKYDLEIVELTWNPPEGFWEIYEWCTDHRFRTCVDFGDWLIEAVSNKFLRGHGPYTNPDGTVQPSDEDTN